MGGQLARAITSRFLILAHLVLEVDGVWLDGCRMCASIVEELLHLLGDSHVVLEVVASEL